MAKFNSKFDIGQIVYIIFKKEVERVRINHIYINHLDPYDKPVIDYNLDICDFNCSLNEGNIFATEAEAQAECDRLNGELEVNK